MGALRRALTSLGEPLRDDELDDMLGQAEVDGDGNVEYKGQGRIVTYSGVSCEQRIMDAQMCFAMSANVDSITHVLDIRKIIDIWK